MEPSKRTFKLLAVGTALVLLYVHGQVAILRVSYSIQKKEKEVAYLSENYKVMRFQLERLQSPSFLDRQLKQRSLNLAVPRQREVLKILTPRTNPSSSGLEMHVKSQPFSWAGLIKEAQAKTSK